MSKIFKAQQKKVEDSTGFAADIKKPGPAEKKQARPPALKHAEPPKEKQAGPVVLFPAPKGAQLGDFNRLAQQTIGLRQDERGSVLFFASSTPGEGASYVSYNLAVTLADVYSQKVAWVDANFLSPQKSISGPGWLTLNDILENPNQVGAMAVNTNPFLIPGGTNLMGARGLVATNRYQDVLDELSSRFDFVIVDVPPVLDSPETGLMAQGGEGLVLVIEQKHLKWEIVEHGLQILRSKGVQVLGSVINRREFTLPKFIYDRL